MSDTWGDCFGEDERALLAPFVTDLDAPIFGLRNLPEVVKGALFSRYSRTDKSLRRILLDEFIQAPESGFAAIVGGASATGASTSSAAAAEQIVAVRQAEAFYERVLIGYGDDSVAELGGAHVACEGISNIAAKALEDSRLGISPLEKSTRYVVFNRKLDGRYRYAREPQIMASRHAARYESALDGLFDAYSALLAPTIAAVRAAAPCEQGTSERAYNSATRAKACDLLRGLLPMATLTNVGLFGNGRAFEYLLTRLYASSLDELPALAADMQRALDALIPSFVKRASSERGRAHQDYLRGMRERVAAAIGDWGLGIGDWERSPRPPVPSPQSPVTLVEYDPDAEAKTVAAIVYPHTDVPLEQVRALADRLSAEERLAVIRAYVGERGSRFHRPGRAFEDPYYTFDILADLGAYRDLQRHRILTQDRQRYTIRHGYVTPPELEDAGLAVGYVEALERAAEAVDAIAADLPEQAQYAVPMAFRIRWRIKLNLRAAYHLAELRSAPQGHPAYRRVAQAIYEQIRAVHPALAEGMRFVDMADYALERLDAERRLDAKISRAGNRDG